MRGAKLECGPSVVLSGLREGEGLSQRLVLRLRPERGQSDAEEATEMAAGEGVSPKTGLYEWRRGPW